MSQSKKKFIQKSDIGEPVLISTTSVIDTIALPAGASLRNGMDDVQKPAPPLPPLHPMRKFGFRRNGAMTPTGSNPGELNEFLAYNKSTSHIPSGRSVSSSGSAGSGGSGGTKEVNETYYPLSSDEAAGWKPRHGLRKSSSEGEKLGRRLRGMEMTAGPPGTNAPKVGVMDGGMF
jgi:hypothetical protein